MQRRDAKEIKKRLATVSTDSAMKAETQTWCIEGLEGLNGEHEW